MTRNPHALTLPPIDDDDHDNPQRPETDVWTPGRVTIGAWAPDRHDASEARADR